MLVRQVQQALRVLRVLPPPLQLERLLRALLAVLHLLPMSEHLRLLYLTSLSHAGTRVLRVQLARLELPPQLLREQLRQQTLALPPLLPM
jgi:hypothetical protein